MDDATLHKLMLTTGALATGLIPLEAAFPPAATPYIKGAAAICALLTTVLGAMLSTTGAAAKAALAKLQGGK
jgi:hypothetical protein